MRTDNSKESLTRPEIQSSESRGDKTYYQPKDEPDHIFDPPTQPSVDDIHKLSLDKILEKSHIIIGSNGKCVCGIYEGTAFTCQSIIKMKIHPEINNPDFTGGLDEGEV